MDILKVKQAITSLVDDATYVVKQEAGGIVFIKWESDTEQTQPSDAEIQAEITRLQAEYDSQEYARNRASAYPPIGDQLDMIYHAGLGGDAFQAAISAVKQEYPK